MKWLAAAAGELAGLFVEDAGFALAILAWVALAAFGLRGVAEPWRGALLLAGFLALLAENVLRAARRR